MAVTERPKISDEARRERRRAARERTRRQRRLAGALLLAVPVFVGGGAVLLGGSGGAGQEKANADPAKADQPPPPPELPTGGRRIFPDRRIVAFYGAPQHEELGVLGIGSPDRALRKLRRQAEPYARKTRPVLLAAELITVVAANAAGNDGQYRTRQSDAVIRRYLRAARRAKALLVLDVQPGRSDFVTEVRRLARWLREPDVGVALDPEWRMEAGQVPGQVIGSVSADEVNATSAFVADIVRERNLPEKLFLVHQFTPNMVRDKARVLKRPGLAVTFNVDGFGDQPNKLAKWREFTRERTRFHDGYKLFYREDTDLMRPAEVMRMKPRPDLVVYE